MSTISAVRHLTGVAWHKRRGYWRVKIFHRHVNIYLGNYHDPDLAAWVADVARYIVMGLNRQAWNHRAEKPNGPPRLRDDFPCSSVIELIANSGVLSPKELQERTIAFKQACVVS